MRRLHLAELHEMAGFPPVWRDLLTDFLSFFAATFKPYSAVAPILADALKKTGAIRIVDLCSGAGKPIVALGPELRAQGVSDIKIVLTDKYPHADAWAGLGEAAGQPVTFEPAPVDATDVPDHLDGFRTLFTSFHHFAPMAAFEILEDAVRKRQGIAIFDYTERNWQRWAVPVLMIPLFVWLCTPFLRPFRWRRFLWTYFLPVVPIVALWDGLVSCLRTYSPEELRLMIDGLDDSTYTWNIGRVRSIGLSRVTFAVGLPVLAVGTRGQQDPRVADDIEGEGN